MKNVPLLPEDAKNEILSHMKEDEQCETAYYGKEVSNAEV